MTPALPTTATPLSVPASPARKLHVVMIDEELPYPPLSGKRIRTLNLTQRLARRHRLTYVAHRNSDPDEAHRAAKHFANLGIRTIIVDRAIPPKSGPGFYARLAANLFSPLPYSVASHVSPELRATLGELARAARRSISGTANGRPTLRRYRGLPAGASSWRTTSSR